MNVLVRKEDSETVMIRIDGEIFGLSHDTFDEKFKENGMEGGAVTKAEITVPLYIATELVQRLTAELEAID